MHDNPLVSVVIPCYNAEKWVADAINGILRQTYSPIEIIVIDDGSTDGSLDVIRSFGDRVRYETGPNRGGNVARNRGFALSRGEYVMFHDADDWISEDTIAQLVEGIEGTENTLVWCDWYHYREAPEKTIIKPGEYTQITPDSDDLLSWFKGWGPLVHAALWPRQVVSEMGGWDESLTAAQDLEFYERALLHGVAAEKVAGGAAYYRADNPNSIRHRHNAARTYSELKRTQKLDAVLTDERRIEPYKVYIARQYINCAIGLALIDPELSAECEKRARELAGFKAYSDGSLIHRVLCYAFSVSFKEKLARRLADIGIGRKIRKDALKRASR